jgi:hypothetical protein
MVHLGYATRNTRVLARAAVRAVELEPSPPQALVASIRDLAAAVRALETALDTGEGEEAVRRAARAAVLEASLPLEDGSGFAIGALVGQVRSIATDLLRALGLGRSEAVEFLREPEGAATEV